MCPVDLKGLKIVVDCAEGASYYTSVRTLEDLGANLIPIHITPDGTNINANCGSTHMDELQARVVYEKADLGIAFDGDADRMLAVDENGKMVDGDQLMAICGNYMKEKGTLKKNHDRCNGYDKPWIHPDGRRKGHSCRKDQGRRPLCA